MNLANQKRAFTKVLGLLSTGALTLLITIPATAQSAAPQSMQDPNPATPSRTPTDPAFGGNPNLSNPRPEGSSSSDSLRSPREQEQSENRGGPSAVGEGFPGPSETPSGSPSVPGNSSVDDPGLNRGGSSNTERDTLNNSDIPSSPNSSPNMRRTEPSVPRVNQNTVPGQTTSPDSRQSPSSRPGVGGPDLGESGNGGVRALW